MAVYHTPTQTLKPFGTIVPPAFRETLLSAFPELNNPGHLRVIERSMTHGDLTGKGIALSQRFMAWAYDKEEQLRSRNFAAWPYLEELQSIIPGFKVGEYSYTARQARFVESRGILPDLWDSTVSEPAEIRDQVDFVTGERITDADIREFRVKAAAISASYELFGPQGRARDYFLRNYDHEFAEILLKRLPFAREAVSSLANADDRRVSTLALNMIEANPSVLLRPSPNTWRLFSVTGLGHTNLNRDIREILYGVDEGLVLPPDDWDLPQAQLRLLSDMLEIEAIIEFIADGGVAWEFFADVYGVPVDAPFFKDACKRALYTLIFGGALKTVRANFLLTGGGLYDPEVFMGTWLVRELAKARDEHLEALSRPGEVVEVMPGVLVPFGNLQGAAVRARARTLMAFQVQAREQVELMGLFDRAERSGLRVVNYLFDGLYVRSGA